MANNFWSSVKKLIKQQNMTQRGLSASIGLSERTIEQWILRDSMPTADIAVKIADKLNVSVEFLVTGKKTKPEIILEKWQEDQAKFIKEWNLF